MVDTLCARDIWLLWFLLALFEALMIYVGIKCLTKNRYMQIILVLLVFVLGYCLSQKYGSANFYYLDQGMMAVLLWRLATQRKNYPGRNYIDSHGCVWEF